MAPSADNKRKASGSRAVSKNKRQRLDSAGASTNSSGLSSIGSPSPPPEDTLTDAQIALSMSPSLAAAIAQADAATADAAHHTDSEEEPLLSTVPLSNATLSGKTKPVTPVSRLRGNALEEASMSSIDSRDGSLDPSSIPMPHISPEKTSQKGVGMARTTVSAAGASSPEVAMSRIAGAAQADLAEEHMRAQEIRDMVTVKIEEKELDSAHMMQMAGGMPIDASDLTTQVCSDCMLLISC